MHRFEFLHKFAAPQFSKILTCFKKDQDLALFVADFNEFCEVVHLEDKRTDAGNGETRKLMHEMIQWNGIYGYPPKDMQFFKYVVENIKCTSIVEIGAGNGLYAKMFSLVGIQVAAYDDGSNDIVNEKQGRPDFFDGKTKKGTEDVLKTVKGHADVLFISWPRFNSDMAYKALSLYQGNHFIYVGTNKGDCCANDAFFALLDLDWTLMQTFDQAFLFFYPSFIRHYHRKHVGS